MAELVGLRAKDNHDEGKKRKTHKKVCHRKKTYIWRLSKLFRSNTT